MELCFIELHVCVLDVVHHISIWVIIGCFVQFALGLRKSAHRLMKKKVLGFNKIKIFQ